jgi:hypothetical protein
MKTLCLLLATLLGLGAFSAGLSAAEPSPAALVGKWAATFESNRSEPITVTYVFTLEGGKLTGTAASNFTGQGVISEVKVDKEYLTFIEKFAFDGMPLQFTYTVRLSGDEMQLKRTGGSISGEQTGTAKRVKEAAPAPAAK